jgi:hypothetical protein
VDDGTQTKACANIEKRTSRRAKAGKRASSFRTGPVLVVFLLLVLVAGLLVYLAFRGRVSSWLLMVLILVPSSLVAGALGQLLYVLLWTIL